MKVCVLGAGAIGSHLAARLGKAGREVSVVARGRQLEAIAERGLVVHTPQETMRLRPRAVSDARELGVQDGVIVTVKAPALPAMAPSLAHLIGPDTVVAFISNGVPWWYFGADEASAPARHALDPQGQLAAVTRQAQVLGGVVYSACTVTEPGVVQVASASSRLLLGHPEGLPSPRGEWLARSLSKGGVAAGVTGGIRSEVWAKWVANIGTGLIASLTDAQPNVFLQDPACESLVRDLVAQACRLAAAEGHPVDFPIEEQMQKWRQSHHLPSIAQDIQLGRPIEFDALYGVPLLLARRHGLELPLLASLSALVKARARQRGCLPAAAPVPIPTT